MKSLIIVSGNLGSTLKVGNDIAVKLGNSVVFDTSSKQKIDFSGFDNYIFGSNIRIFSLNNRFKKYAKKLKKYYKSKNAYIYLLGSDLDNRHLYVEKAKKIIPSAKLIVHCGGEMDAQNAKGFAKKIIESVSQGMTNDGKELPKINYEQVEYLIDNIID